MEKEKLFVIGGTGFIGTETIREAVGRGWEVLALARTEGKAARLRELGAVPVPSDARGPRGWIGAARGADVLLDLAQPELPSRIRPRDIQAVSRTRQAMTRELLEALRGLAREERPLLVSVSGIDDLAPDEQRRVDGTSGLRTPPVGFGHVGVPVRQLIEGSGVAAAFFYLGTVYGPGKSFAATIFPRLARGRMLLPRPARNRLPLVHVRDAARAIVHLASLGRDRLAGRSWILVDPAGGAPLGRFFDEAAAWMGVAPPTRAPAWLLSKAMGRVLFETLTRDVEALPSDLVSTGFRFEFPTVDEGLPATLSALGYARKTAPVPRGRSRVRFAGLAAVTLAALVAANAPLLPVGAPALASLAGGQPILDMRLAYSPDAAHRFLEVLGPAGRARYLEMLWTVDLALPALFSLFLWSAVSRGALRRWRWTALVAGAADYLENAAETALILAYPERRDALAAVSSAITVSKFALYLGVLALAAGGAWLARARALKGRALP